MSNKTLETLFYRGIDAWNYLPADLRYLNEVLELLNCLDFLKVQSIFKTVLGCRVSDVFAPSATPNACCALILFIIAQFSYIFLCACIVNKIIIIL
jgi:hypothetical protein